VAVIDRPTALTRAKPSLLAPRARAPTLVALFGAVAGVALLFRRRPSGRGKLGDARGRRGGPMPADCDREPRPTFPSTPADGRAVGPLARRRSRGWRLVWRLSWLIREVLVEFANRAAPDLSWIVDDLAIGGRVLADEWPAVAAAGIGAVVDCRAEARDPEERLMALGLTFLHLPTPDSGHFTPEQVAQGVDWIEAQRDAGRRVLVHCQAGKGRSVLIGAAALTRRGFTPDEAVALIRERRPVITPTPGQLRRLRDYAAGSQLALPLDLATPATPPAPGS
jgi:protein tyrosine phosphatase (PTP) superfamily phosphohydrolase (DUF442 family)